jgi:hypothetical protein
MGCDIHLTLEYRLRKEKVHKIDVPDGREPILLAEEREWQWGCIIPPHGESTWSDRVYGMFAALADVRNYYGNDIKPIKPRGIPYDVTWHTLRHYTDKVIPDDEYKEKVEKDMDRGYISESDAKKYVDDGWSEYIEFADERNRYISGKYCSCPDWHSASWCTTQEMEEAYKKVFLNDDGSIKPLADYIEWAALLGAMKGYEASGEYECRAVFWFDN